MDNQERGLKMQAAPESAGVENAIGERIKNLRMAAGMSQSELARKVGVTPQAVQQWEQGKNCPRNAHITELASRLGSSKKYLLIGGDESLDVFDQVVIVTDSLCEPELLVGDLVKFNRCSKDDISDLVSSQQRFFIFRCNDNFEVRKIGKVNDKIFVINSSDTLFPYNPIDNLPDDVEVYGVAVKLTRNI